MSAEIDSSIRIIIIAGPPGAGKDAMTAALREAYRAIKVFGSVTTRLERPDDKPTGKYTFVTRAEFAQMEANGEFAWTAEPIPPTNGQLSDRYGTLRKVVKEALTSKWPYIIDVEFNTVQKIINIAGTSAIPFFLTVTPEEAEDRMRRRHPNETEESIRNRVEICRTLEARARGSSIPFIFVPNKAGQQNRTLQMLQFHLRPSRTNARTVNV